MYALFISHAFFYHSVTLFLLSLLSLVVVVVVVAAIFINIYKL